MDELGSSVIAGIKSLTDAQRPSPRDHDCRVMVCKDVIGIAGLLCLSTELPIHATPSHIIDAS
jgi:hypothetical protein